MQAKKEKQFLVPEKRTSKYALKKSDADFTISEEVAREQLMTVLTYYDIDLGRIATDDDKGLEALSAIERSFDAIVDYIRVGKLDIKRNAEGKIEIEHTLESGQSVIYREVNAAAKMSMDRHPVDAAYARRYELMGSLCGLGAEAIKTFKARDLAVTEVLAMLFMNV